MGLPAAKVFISHSHDEQPEVRRLEAALEHANIEAWAYEGDLPFGNDIMDEVKRHICECDHFLVFLSDSSRNSHWVARELGLALERQQQAGSNYPSIIGVLGEKQPDSMVYSPVNFYSGQPYSDRYDFSVRRCFKVDDSVDRLDDLVRHLLPQVTHITQTEGEQGRLLTESFKVYEELFPDEGERDDPEDIATWIDEARRADVSGRPWREFYAVLHILDHVIGMIFLSGHIERKWSFGSYFGVSRAWRQQGRAEWFLEQVQEKLLTLLPHVKGIIFEVDPVDFKFLERVAARPSLLGSGDESLLFWHLRNLRRIQLYHSYGAQAVLGQDDSPLPYWQPAMDEPLGPENERRLILMVFPLKGMRLEQADMNEILNFVYDDLFGDAYGASSAAGIPGFSAYCEEVKRRVRKYADQGWRFGQVRVPKRIRQLIRRAYAEGLQDRLAL